MKKSGRLAVVLGMSLVFLAGCNGQVPQLPEVIDSPTVSVGDDGQITYWLIGEFDKDYYKVSELAEMAVEEAVAFNTAWDEVIQGGEGESLNAVSVVDVKALQDSKGTVVITYRFGNWKSCTAFNGNEMFCGTVLEAVNAQYAMKELKSVKDGSVLTGSELEQKTDAYLIITNEKADVYCPGKVAYISEGAVLNADGSVNTTGTEELVYILLK